MIGAVQLALDGSVATVGTRPEDDFYATPPWLADAVLAEIRGRFDSALDPGGGSGLLMAACRRRWPYISAMGVEIDPDRAQLARRFGAVEVADFLAWAAQAADLPRRWDLVIANPPFKLWDEFVRAALPLVAPGGTALVLGFVNVLGGQGRARWWRENPPSRIWLSPRRASFTADGQTDCRDVCWVQWGPGERRAELGWLPTEGG